MSVALEQHQWQGQEFYDAGKLTEALAEWHIASELAPDNPNNHLWIGYCLRVKADKTQDQAGWQAAAAAFQRAVEIDPANSYAHHALAGMHSRLGKKQEAVAELKAAVAIDPNNLEAQSELGSYQVSTGNFRGAIQTIRAMSNCSDSEELRRYLADKDRSRQRRQFLVSLGAGLAAVLVGVWIWSRRRRDARLNLTPELRSDWNKYAQARYFVSERYTE